jgi:hypothetical protein
VAEDGEELFDLGPLTSGTGNLLIAEDQRLKVIIAFHAVIFKNRHRLPPSFLCCLNITPLKAFFQPFRSFFHFILACYTVYSTLSR